MARAIVRTDAEIDAVLRRAEDTVGQLFSMKYEEGILEMYHWLIGEQEESPLGEG